MCQICAASKSFNFTCTEERPADDVSSDATAQEIEAANNALNKPSFTWSQAAQQISDWQDGPGVEHNKWNDGGSNALGTAGTVTYSYSANPPSGLTQLTSDQILFSEQAIKAITEVADITMTRIGSGTTGSQAYSDAGELTIESIPNYGGGVGGGSYFLNNAPEANEYFSGYARIGATAGYTEEGDFGLSLAMHEIMHALGFNHPGAYNGSGATNYADQAEYFEDSEQFTVMSYWSASNTGADHFEWVRDDQNNWVGVGGAATNLLLHDIAALQFLYGANTTTRTGDTVYGFNSNTGDFTWTLDNRFDSIIGAVWDAGGIDTLDVSGFDSNADIDLREEAFSSFGGLTYNFSIAKGVTFENAIGGSGDDRLRGNDVTNRLEGLDGEDTLLGFNGSDVLLGGLGDDSLDGGEGADWLDGGADQDTLLGGLGDDTIVYDAADDWAGGGVDGGHGFDTLLFEAVKTSIDLTLYGFEQAALQLLDTGNALWREVLEYYNTSDQKTSETRWFDDGTSTITDYDVAEVETWSERIRTYDENGVLVSETFVDDMTIPTGPVVNLTDLYPDAMSVSMSSTYGSYDGDLVLDNKASTAALALYGPDEFIRLDLGGGMDITRVEIKNGRSAGDRLDGSTVSVLDA
ncbi:MAG: M10 family metallopeptidase C-terminal domain-containing protein, partial [Pseudomonadota bacterium]